MMQALIAALGARVAAVLAAAALVLVLAMPAGAAAERRVALVIGNGDYRHVTRLPNPANDARGLAATLEQLGFEVHVHVDLDVAGMRQALRAFTDAVAGADVALFFYAGHGLQFRGSNYLAPVDARLEREADLHFEALEVDLVLDLLEAPDRTTLIFLDACRDNPLARTLARNLGPTRSAQVGRGLARVDSGIGTLIAFATAPGAVALDGADDHSPFTAALLEYVATPGLEVRQMLSRVRDKVYRETQGQQLPWDNSSLRSDFYFTPPPDPAPGPQVAAVAPPDAAADQGPGRTSNAELAYWQAIQSSTRPAEYELFLRQFPDSIFADLARARLAALQAEPAPASPAPAAAPASPAAAPAAPEPEQEQEQETAALPPEPAPESAPPPAPAVTLDVIDAEYVATTDANFRAAPSVEGERLGTLRQGTRVTVRGKVEGLEWYQIERPGEGGVAYVYAPLLQDAAAYERAQAAQVAAAAAAPEPAPAPAPAETAPEIVAAAPASEAAATPAAAPEPTPSAEGRRSSEPQTAALTAPRQAPAFDAEGLAGQLLDQWQPARLRYEDPVYGQCNEPATVDRWQPAAGGPRQLALAQSAGGTVRARAHSSFKLDGELVAMAAPEAVSLLEYKYLKANTRGGWCPALLVESSEIGAVVGRAPYLARHGFRLAGMDRYAAGGFRFVYGVGRITSPEGERECVAFIGQRQRHRVDGFSCGAPDAALAGGGAAVLQRLRIAGVLG